jgi:hypothetical protein
MNLFGWYAIRLVDKFVHDLATPNIHSLGYTTLTDGCNSSFHQSKREHYSGFVVYIHRNTMAVNSRNRANTH